MRATVRELKTRNRTAINNIKNYKPKTETFYDPLEYRTLRVSNWIQFAEGARRLGIIEGAGGYSGFD